MSIRHYLEILLHVFHTSRFFNQKCFSLYNIQNFSMHQCFNPESLKTIDREIYSSNVTFKHGTDQREEVKDYYLKAFALQQLLFSLIKDPKFFYQRPEPLRHPLIFYYGHTAAFIVNKLVDSGCLKRRVNPQLERILAVGVDQNSWDDLNQEHYNWPSFQQVKRYRGQVKTVFLQALSSISPQITWTSQMWAAIMSIEHQKVHIQTSAAIIRRLPIHAIHPSSVLIDCPYGETKIQTIPRNRLVQVDDFDYVFQMSPQTTDVFRWDMELGKKMVSIKSFFSSQFLVSNGQFYEFFKDGGYQNLQFWTQQGKQWVSWSKVKHPIFWHLEKQREECQDQRQFLSHVKLRTMNQLRKMPWDWPAEVNNLQARAFCNWKSSKQGKNIRLQNQNEYLAITTKFKEQQNTWQYQHGGNINLQYWFSPCPVNMFKHGDFYDVLGNSWQLLDTALYPYENFVVNPYFQDVSTPCMDGKHDILRGGSFCSLGNYALGTYRNYFRRHFYTFSSFRYVVSDGEKCQPTQFLKKAAQFAMQSDQQIEKALKDHYIDGHSYIYQVENMIKELIKNQMKQVKVRKSLIIGCSVGKLCFSLTRFFERSYGVDASVRFFNLAIRLMQEKQIKFKNHDIKVNQNIQQIKDRLRFYQFDPSNIDCNKVSGLDFILIDGYSIRNATMKTVVHNLLENSRLISDQGFTLCLIECEEKGNIIIQQEITGMTKIQCKKVMQKQLLDSLDRKLKISCYNFYK